jgi:Zinc-finger double-stranded RNA-binding
VTSRKHQYRLSLPVNPLYCQPCDRHFPDTKQLEEHKRGNPHIRAVIASNRAKARK